MKKWQIYAVLVALILVSVTGWLSQKAGNDVNHPPTSSNMVGTSGWDIVNIPLNPDYGDHYHVEISSIDGRPISVYFTDLSSLMDARANSTFSYLPERSVQNSTRIVLDGQLPGDDVYEIMVLSADGGPLVPITSDAQQAGFPPVLMPLFQAVYFICWFASIMLFFLLLHIYQVYRDEHKTGH